MSKRVYIVYDERAMFGNTDDATVLESFDAANDKAARREALQTWQGTPFVLYGANLENGVATQDSDPVYTHYAPMGTN